jgi:GT2 family glycosyltransferase
MRDDKMKECVDSIRKYYPDDWVRIYIADQNESVSEETQKYYDELKAKGHVVVKVPYNSGLAYGRNILVNQVKEPYLLIVDDDFKFTDKTDLTKFKNVLESKDDIGICGGKLLGQDPYLAWMYYNPILKKIFKIKTNFVYHPIFQTKKYPYNPSTTLYEYTDIVLNFFLAKTEIFKDFQWDNHLILCEHTDAFLRLKETKWKVVYAPEVECEHKHFDNSNDYQNYRSHINRDIGVDRFCKKWGINDLSDICSIPSKCGKEKSFVIKENPIIESNPIRKTDNVNLEKSINNMFTEVTNILNALNLTYCLAKETCKDAVLYNNIQNGNKLFFGCIITDELKTRLFDSKFSLNGKCFQKDGYLIYFLQPELKTKNWVVNNKVYKVPFPLIGYLKDNFGSSINNELKQRGYI